MKRHINNLFPLPALIAGLGLILVGRVTAQTFTTLHSFVASHTNSSGIFTNREGSSPPAGLILSGNTLYGTTSAGGSAGNGTVFKLNADGTSFTNLHSFTATPGPFYNNSDGASPYGGVILSSNTLYGTTFIGGTNGDWGTVFKVNTDGTGFTNLHSFTALSISFPHTNSDGRNPRSELILSGNTLYGTANGGGSAGNGTVFKLNTDGSGFTNLHSFTALLSNTNGDGAGPVAGLILSGNTLYGTAVAGGNSSRGTVFKVKTDGSGFTNLHSFTAASYPDYTNSDGANPFGGLILSGNILYGTASGGGSAGAGTLFSVNTDGTGFTNLHSYSATSTNSSGVYTNSDGANPYGGLLLSGNILYGTANAGGSSGSGTLFAVNTDGTGFTALYAFTATSDTNPFTNMDGAYPHPGFLSGNTLYGTASAGGSAGNGTVFSLSFRPQLTIMPFGANVILTWPTNVAGFDYTGYTLQSTTNLVSPAVWSSVSPGPVVIGGQDVVINPISGRQRFYRLSQ